MHVKALANTDTAAFPDEFVKVYYSNYLAGQKNEDCIGKLDSEVIKAQDSSKDIETNTCSASIPDNISLPQTANLPGKLKLRVSARVMLTDNISVSGRLLISGSIGTVIKYLARRSKPLCSTIFVKLDNPKTGNSLKGRRLFGELEEFDQLLLEQKGCL